MTLLDHELRRELDRNAHLVALLAPAGVVRRSAPADDHRSLDGIDLDREAVVQGVVIRDGSPLPGVPVRLLDGRGSFVAEVPTGRDGTFRFFAEPGDWSVVVLGAGREVPHPVTARHGSVVDVVVAV